MHHRVAVLTILFCLCVPTVSLLGAEAAPAQMDESFKQKVQPFLNTYCSECHGPQDPKGQLNLMAYADADAVIKDFRQWQKVLARLSAKEMPPDDAEKFPTDDERAAAVGWIQALVKYETDRNAGDPGPVLARRLSNAEFDYTIRDLTGFDIRPTREFPVDPANQAGFDNSGESLAMSPALVNKYLDAVRNVSEHIVFKPNGFTFAPFTVVTETDRDKYAVNRIVDFYKANAPHYVDYFAAAWRFRNRAALGKPNQTLEEAASESKLSAKYLKMIWDVVSGEKQQIGPIAAVQMKFDALPKPDGAKEPPALKEGCEKIRDFILDLRPKVMKDIANFPTRGIAAGSQPLVLWKDREYAANRMTYAGNASELDLTAYATSDPEMLLPQDDAGKAAYEQSFKQFCAVFPDWFYISERGRMFLTNPQEIANEIRNNTGRLLGAGFHSQMGYFRDDQPLCELVLDAKQNAELDQLWNELPFVTLWPIRQFKQFIWFERGEPPSFMATREFDSFRSEDDDVVSAEKIARLSEVYLAKCATAGVTEAAQEIVKDYFQRMNASIRALEKAQKDAEPSHLDALLALAQKAYRRPLAQGEKDDILKFYRSLRSEGLDHEEAIRDSVMSILMAPAFLYRVEPAQMSQEIRPLSDYELASRLSYFLWASMPDDELLSHASAGDLHQPSVLVAQARRMLNDPKVHGFATEFAGNWLDIRRFEEHNAVDRDFFPQFTNELRSAMFEEPMRFFVDLAQRNGSILDFVYGDYTFVSPVLAKHYGMPEIPAAADSWVRIDNAGRYERGGLLPMSVFLTKNAPGLRTSPVKRGYWVVRRLLGEEIPPPPPNVPVLPSKESDLGNMTLREVLAKHREDKSCSACHEKFDSVGVVFEGFGPIGEARKLDLGNRPVETTATFPDGSSGDGLEGLRTYIREKRQGNFIDNFCRKMTVYALGRSLLPSDEPLIAEMKQKLESDQDRFFDVVQSIITSRQFLNKRGAVVAMKE
jgi:hypothetical protein